MRRTRSVLSLIAAGMVVPACLGGHVGRVQAQGSGCTQVATLDIVNVHVIDVTTGQVSFNNTITIAGPRICRVAAEGTTSRASQQVDGRGRFAVPGLWLAGPQASPTLRQIGHGITNMTNAGVPDVLTVAKATDLVDSLAARVAAGWSALQALQSVTVDAAMRSGASAGRLVPHFAANLLLLESNPLEDITNLRSTTMVVWQGQPLGLVQLARARAGRAPRKPPSMDAFSASRLSAIRP